MTTDKEPRPMPLILRLPNELLMMIFESLSDNGVGQPSATISSEAIDASPNKNNAITVVARTCKRFRELATTYLSHRVILRRSRDAPVLSSRLRAYPHLAQRVRKVVVYEYSDVLAATRPGSTLYQVAAEKPYLDEGVKDLWLAMLKSPLSKGEGVRAWLEVLRDRILDLIELLLLVPRVELFRFVGRAIQHSSYWPPLRVDVNPFQHALIVAISCLQDANLSALRSRILPNLRDVHVCGRGSAVWECAMGTVMRLPKIETLRLDQSAEHGGIYFPVTMGTGASSTLRHLVITTPSLDLHNLSAMIRSIGRLDTFHAMYRFPFFPSNTMDEFLASLHRHRGSLSELKLTDEVPFPFQYSPVRWDGYCSLVTLHVPDYLLFRPCSSVSDVLHVLPPHLISLGIIPWTLGDPKTTEIVRGLVPSSHRVITLRSIFIHPSPGVRRRSRIRGLSDRFERRGIVCRYDPDAFVTKS
ncbi:hypothetical protein ASPVEDRAFT_27590 [Aspergillus versicolor CBS 583.65]|uniref:Uncharacterized protein n=1 Tax=Aspergillus versicolor CBS 583.65 TaxID=1036611 RepID=A0A1L9PHA8_ASPVE|nr:uncharacterized protein ASPVEDRAFT_27590 [Aspergillus versicolor CBS 583.65]OJJ00882.1 hypothetical protein ASPVEDRAFT_27590 [Aspergillus versicolor CBS 583.65]